MRKLYTLKNWYPLEEAAKRLTVTLGEDVSVNDILQLAVEGHIGLSWYLRHIYAREVAPVTRIINFGDLPELFKKNGASKDSVSDNSYAEGYEYLSEVKVLEGAYKLELERCGALKDWVLSIITQTGGQLIALDGFVVSDHQGNLWQIMDTFTAQDKATHRKMMNHDNDHHDYEIYFPSGTFPLQTDLGITKNGLEAFERLVSEEHKETPKQSTSLHLKEHESLFKLVIGMAIDGYGHNPGASRTPTAKDIASGLLTHGISIDEDTVRKWLSRAKEFLPADWQKD